MPVWLSIIAYSLLMSVIGTNMYKNKKSAAGIGTVSTEEDTRNISLFFALASFALLIFFVGNRSWIFDTCDYQLWFDVYFSDDLSQIPEFFNGTREVKGPLFVSILVIFKHYFGGTSNDWFMLIAVIQGVLLAVFLYKHSTNFTFSIFLFYFTNSYLWFVNGMRQLLAITLVLFFTDLLKEKKTIRFIIVVIIAYFIHSSVLFWIPAYFIVHLKPWSKKLYIFTIILIAGLLLLSKSSILGGSDYEYMTSEASTGINPIRLIVVSVPMIIAFVKRDVIAQKASPFINICINLSVIISGCYLVAMFTNGIMGRMAAYFEFYNLILLPWMIKNAFYEDKSRSIAIACVIGYILFGFYNLVICRNGIYCSDPLHIYFNADTLFG